MSDQFNEFDQIFRDRLRDQTASPPDSVWSNIQAERSFGHIVANKISSSWRIIGTILLLTMAGGSSFLLLKTDKQNHQQADQISSEITIGQADQTIESIPENQILNQPVANNKASQPHFPIITLISNNSKAQTKNIEQSHQGPAEKLFVEPDLFASNSYGAFGKPEIEDPHLAALIDEMDGWGTAKPSSVVKYYKLEQLEKKNIDGNRLVKAPLNTFKDYDYVIEANPKKGFRERSTLNFYFGPQFIHKNLTPEYNMTTSFLEKRMETEHTRLAYTAGVNLQYELKKHKFFESGIQFTQIYEEVRIDGDKRFTNQYDFVEVPLLIGYRDRESKWGWSVKGGLGVQVFNSYEGYILKKVEDRIGSAAVQTSGSENNSQYRISGKSYVNTVVKNDHKLSEKQDRNEVYDLSSSENPYRSSGVVNLHLAAGVTYYHSITTSFSVTPYYRQNINSLSKTSANFKERITFMGVLFGTRMNF